MDCVHGWGGEEDGGGGGGRTGGLYLLPSDHFLSLYLNRHTDRRREKEIWNVLSVLPSSLSIPPEMPQCPPAAMYHRGLAMGSSSADAFYNLPDFFSPKGGREREKRLESRSPSLLSPYGLILAWRREGPRVWKKEDGLLLVLRRTNASYLHTRYVCYSASASAADE